MSYRPFDTSLEDIEPEDLAILRDTHEGWYVDYKSEFMRERDLAKALASFANTFGGWLFFGVDEDPDTLIAARFRGVERDAIGQGLESLRNASKDLLNPPVYYQHRVFHGPIDTIKLDAERAIVAVYIPEGADTPYVHNDGRIYSRVGDSSQPKPVTDRATFDLLAQRGAESRKKLADLVQKEYDISKGEDDVCYIHLIILTDPYSKMMHWYDGDFGSFMDTMRQPGIPFDNFYSSSDGYVARQVEKNDPYNRVLTWHFSKTCRSFITLPIPVLSPAAGSEWLAYNIGEQFRDTIAMSGLESARILDLNIVIDYCLAVVRRHQELISNCNISEPLRVKSRIDNAWRTIPFVDIQMYLEHVEAHGVPLNQEAEILVPPGTTLDSFWTLPLSVESPGEGVSGSDIRTIVFATQILDALGVPRDLSIQCTAELLALGGRRMEFQRRQASS